MSTGHCPQTLGHAFLPSGNVAIVHVVTVTDPEHIPTGAEPGEWAEVTRIEDPGAIPIRWFDVPEDLFELSLDEMLDPPEIVEDPANGVDYDHLAIQFEEPVNDPGCGYLLRYEAA